MKKIALIPGSFDPITKGHLELVKFASALFDEVVVCICINPEKTHLFNEKARLDMIAKAIADYPNARAASFHGMTADFAVSIGAEYIVRGIRNEKDTKYELEMADFNRNYRGIRTLLVPASSDIVDISSTLVREKLALGEKVDGLLPENVL